jgi:hypothetical protein
MSHHCTPVSLQGQFAESHACGTDSLHDARHACRACQGGAAILRRSLVAFLESMDIYVAGAVIDVASGLKTSLTAYRAACCGIDVGSVKKLVQEAATGSGEQTKVETRRARQAHGSSRRTSPERDRGGPHSGSVRAK